MFADEVAGALIVPAAGAVDGTGGIQLVDHLADLVRIELAPALVEGDPHAETRDIL